MIVAQATDSFKNDFITCLAQIAKMKHLMKQEFIRLLKLTSFFKIKISTFIKTIYFLFHGVSKAVTFNGTSDCL
jgi:hypothetical protein